MAAQRMTKAQREAIRVEIAQLQDRFPPKKVPDRVLKGSAQDVWNWKDAVAKPPYFIRNQPGENHSGAALAKIRDTLAVFIQSVN